MLAIANHHNSSNTTTQNIDSKKTFEVDQIVCGRKHKGTQEYLVYWKGFDLSASTWEPVENLISCPDLIDRFQRKVSPIPGANPFVLEHLEKTKKVHVKMLLGRKSRAKKSRSLPKPILNPTSDNKTVVKLEVPRPEKRKELNTTPTPENKSKSKRKSNNSLSSSTITARTHSLLTPGKRLSEGERLIQATLIHESKTMKPEKGFTKLSDVKVESEEGPRHNNGSNKTNSNNLGASPHKKRCLNRGFNGHSVGEEHLVLSTVERGYMKIALNNINAHNLLTVGMLESLRDCLLKAAKNKDVKAVLLTGNGSYFCSGLDYTPLMNSTNATEYKGLVIQLVSSIRSFLQLFTTFSKPIVCAVNGPALEFGVSLVVNSDFAYGNSKAAFDVVYSKIQLTPIGGMTYLLPKIVGSAMAKSMLYMCGRVSVTAACDRGMLLDMYGVNSFDEDMTKKMSQITSKSGHILEATKRLVDHMDRERLETVCHDELCEYEQALLTEEVKQKLKDDWTVVINLYKDV